MGWGVAWRGEGTQAGLGGLGGKSCGGTKAIQSPRRLGTKSQSSEVGQTLEGGGGCPGTWPPQHVCVWPRHVCMFTCVRAAHRTAGVRQGWR